MRKKDDQINPQPRMKNVQYEENNEFGSLYLFVLGIIVGILVVIYWALVRKKKETHTTEVVEQVNVIETRQNPIVTRRNVRNTEELV